MLVKELFEDDSNKFSNAKPYYSTEKKSYEETDYHILIIEASPEINNESFMFLGTKDYENFDQAVEEIQDDYGSGEIIKYKKTSYFITDLDEENLSASIIIMTDKLIKESDLDTVKYLALDEYSLMVEAELEAITDFEAERKDPYGYRGLSQSDFM